MSVDPQARPRTKRRTFTAADKARILAEYERCSSSLERAALLRREGVYSSHIGNWRAAIKRGSPLSQKPGRRADPKSADVARLRKEVDRLQRRLEKADRTIEVLGKVHALLQLAAGESAANEQPSKKS
jgi:transposase-like protein